MTRVSTGDQPIGAATIVAEEMERWLRELDGFEGLLMMSRHGTTIGLSFWATEEDAERYLAVRRQFVDRAASAAQVEVEETDEFELMFASLGTTLRELAR
jgi:hypothetical protein